MYALVSLLFVTVCTALPTASTAQTPAIPITYSYGGYPRIQADIAWGTKAQAVVPTIFDTGSVGYWVFGPYSIINDGSQYHYTQGPCNKSVKNFYNWPTSSTHSKVVNLKQTLAYGYGGNGKLISASQTINDTFSFGNTNWPALTNNQVALASYARVAQLDDKCVIPESDYDHSILGLAPFGVGNAGASSVGPSFRTNLFQQARTKSRSFSMWFDAPPASAKGRYQGVAVFGAVPSKSKYSGDLVRVKVSPPKDAYIGYYAALPKMSVPSLKNPSGPAKTAGVVDKSVTNCLLDSGTGQDRLPFKLADVTGASGLINYSTKGGTTFLAYNGTCDKIPPSSVLRYTFTGETAGKSVTISVPVRAYARGEFDQIPGIDKNVCGLSLSLDEYGGCTFGAPFFTSVMAVFNDEENQIALAQGGISQGSDRGPMSLGDLTAIVAGQSIPGSI